MAKLNLTDRALRAWKRAEDIVAPAFEKITSDEVLVQRAKAAALAACMDAERHGEPDLVAIFFRLGVALDEGGPEVARGVYGRIAQEAFALEVEEAAA